MDPPVPNDPTLTAENPCKDYWAFKRKRKREHKKQTKAAEADAKVAKLDEDATPSAQRDERPKGKSKNWKNLDISEIKFYTPTIVIDLSFGEKMSEKRLRSLAAQVGYSYASVKSHPRPCPLVLTGLVEGSLTDQFLNNHDGWSNWKVFKKSDPVEKAYPIESIVYLTPDSDNLLESIDHSKVYVIGGIVDDNQLKGLSLSKAVSHGIAHARLPIKERLPNFRNQSLNINHIVDILLSLGEGLEMTKALEKAVPQRYTSPKPAWRPSTYKAPEQDSSADLERHISEHSSTTPDPSTETT